MDSTGHRLCLAAVSALALAATALPATAGVEEACHRLAGSNLDSGLPAAFPGVPFEELDAARAIPACRAALAAEPGNPRLIYQLARALDASDDQFAEAARLYDRAAQSGFPLAINNLAALYADGRGVEKDMQRAITLFRDAAEAGLPMAMTNLAFLHWDGEGLPQDDARAVALFRQAAEAGDGQAMFWLGRARENGRGAARDLDKALEWYRAALRAGDTVAGLDAARLLLRDGDGHSPDHEAAAVEYRLAAAGGDPRAAGWLAGDIRAGRVAPADPDELLRLLTLAASTGDAQALLDLWQALHDAENHAQALTIAYRAYDRAAEAAPSEDSGWPVHRLMAARAVQQSLTASGQAPRSEDELRMFQTDYPVATIRRFTLGFDCSGETAQYGIYVWDWSRGHGMADAQFDWIEQTRGCTVPPEVRRSFAEVWDMAQAAGASYTDLTGQEIGDDGLRYIQK
ncbi:DUF2610 domain-containing protein [Mameliella alba]|uniref:Sel1 repeat family protein n=1 Tax=Mameliella alba TaxID=561184 RepID=A0A0B3SV27_9RHOB|nr:DUF2610 domain-containing protein [Mameliella alba]KHQ54304.1 Sel1 repeat family protein [Mameliella alba]